MPTIVFPAPLPEENERRGELGTYLLVGEVEELVKLNSPVGELPEGPLSLDGGSAGSVGDSVGLWEGGREEGARNESGESPGGEGGRVLSLKGREFAPS